MGACYGKCRSTARLDGKTAVITGSNAGIGQYTALDLYKRGCRVIMACRSTDKGEVAKKEIMKKTANLTGLGELIVEKLDLASLQSVREFCERILASEKEINILINNAGVMMCPRSFTNDGFEMQFGTNHLGHFLLTMLLLPLIIKSKSARILNVSSIMHWLAVKLDLDDLNAEKSYNPAKNYGVSKLANILFTIELAQRLEGTEVTVYALCPGAVNSDATRHVDSIFFPGARWLYKNVGALFQRNIEQGAQTSIYCAVDEDVGKQTGLFYRDCKPMATSNIARDAAKAKKLWELSEKLVKLEGYDPFAAKDTITRL